MIMFPKSTPRCQNGFSIMRPIFSLIVNCLAGACWITACGSVFAQGLIHSLPEDGVSVEYEGTIVQRHGDQDSEPLTWTSELSIKSVGQEQAEYNGVSQACRWIEIKVITGTSTAAGLDPGPAGARIYKVLVPETKVSGDAVDPDTIPNQMLPIVKGYRRDGEGEVQEIQSKSLVYYPMICRLRNYDSPEVISESDVPEVLASDVNVTARRLKGKMVMERQESRSTNEGEYWVSADVPFGLARWIVTDTREEKTATEPRSQFRSVAVVQVDMKLRRIRENVESELVTP
jgi:hypothetical protein